MNENTLEAIKTHALSTYPMECCGLVVIVRGKERYAPCRNIEPGPDRFAIHPGDYAAAEDSGEIMAIVHSHCNRSPMPTQPDLVGCEASGKPWIIIAVPSCETYTFEPSWYVAPLIGREYFHGVMDCFTLVKDYYRETLGLHFPDPMREDEWWLKGANLYMDNIEAQGFVKVDPATMQEHDGLLMQVASPVPNHAAVYVGDGLIIQHNRNRLSSRDIYGGWFQKCTVLVLRHKSLL